MESITNCESRIEPTHEHGAAAWEKRISPCWLAMLDILLRCDLLRVSVVVALLWINHRMPTCYDVVESPQTSETEASWRAEQQQQQQHNYRPERTRMNDILTLLPNIRTPRTAIELDRNMNWTEWRTLSLTPPVNSRFVINLGSTCSACFARLRFFPLSPVSFVLKSKNRACRFAIHRESARRVIYNNSYFGTTRPCQKQQKKKERGKGNRANSRLVTTQPLSDALVTVCRKRRTRLVLCFCLLLLAFAGSAWLALLALLGSAWLCCDQKYS